MQSSVELGPGDRVVFTSDGVNESQDTRHRMFGFGPIERTARRRDLNPSAVIDQLHNQLTLHRAGAPAVDDVTMLCVDRVATG